MTGRPELLRDLDRSAGWVLMVEGVEQSYVDVDDPTHLAFEYMQHMGLALDASRPRPDPLRTLHLGGGAGSMARWLSATRPGSAHVVVEHSRDVLDAVASLGPPPATEFVVAGARSAIEAQPSTAYDAVIWDLYDGPRAVTTELTFEAIAEMRRVLRPFGLLVLNVSDSDPFDVVRPVVATLHSLFDDAVLLAEPNTLRGRRSGNCVLAGAVGAGLPVAAITRVAAAWPVRARTLAGAELRAFVDAAVPATDAAPPPPPDEKRGRAFL